MSIASAVAEFIVELDEVGSPYILPGTDESPSHIFVAFGSAGIDRGQIAFEIDDVETVEAAVVLDVPRANEVSFLNGIGKDQPHIWILFS